MRRVPQVAACRRPFRAMCVRAPADRVDLGYVTEQRRFAGARRRRNYDDSACHSAIERIQKSAAIGFRRVALVPQSEPSSAATTTLSAVDLFCTASLVLARHTRLAPQGTYAEA